MGNNQLCLYDLIANLTLWHFFLMVHIKISVLEYVNWG